MPSKVTLTSDTKVQLLLQISQKVRNTLDLDEILNLLLDTLQSVLDYNAAGIFILTREGLLQTRSGNRALIAGIARRGFDPHPDERDRMLMLGQGITGHVIRTGEAVIIPDVRRDERYVVGRQATLSEITVPIFQDGRVIGALNVESDHAGAFGQADLEILHFFAEAAAISIEKATLHLGLLQKQHLDVQLRTASAVQSRLLPARAPEVPGYDLSGVCLPTYAIGGDYYDYIPLEDGRLGVALADVSGDGVAAALVMSAFRALLRTQAYDLPDPARLCARMNAMLPDFTGESDFVTGVYGILDPRQHTFMYTNFGHPPLLCLRAAGPVELHKAGGPALSVFEQAQYDVGRLSLAPGDTLVIFTDGVTELASPDEAEFGLERLLAALQDASPAPPLEIQARLIRTAREFHGADTFPDDVTLVILRRAL